MRIYCIYLKWLIALLVYQTAEVKSIDLSKNGHYNILEVPSKIEADDVLEVFGNFMLKTINTHVNPCEDFYEFACGNWKNLEEIPAKSQRDTLLQAINNSVSELIEKFLEDTSENEQNNTTAEYKAKKFYRSCIAMGQNLENGYKSLMAWPEFENHSFRDWIDINFLSSNEMNALLPLKTTYNSDTRTTELLLTPPQLVMGDPKLINVHNLTQDFKIIDKNKRNLFVKEFWGMVRFEANLTSHVHTRTKNETERLTLKNFISQHNKDKLNWTIFFNEAFNGTQKDHWIVQNTLQDAKKLVQFLNKTDIKILTNYLKWRTLIKFYYIWKPVGRNITQKEHCRLQAEQYFSYALVPFLTSSIYDKERRADILGLATNMKSIFHNFINRNTFLDEETRSQARTKLNTMDIRAGYTDELSRRNYINDLYNELNVTENWFVNIHSLEVNRAEIKRKSVSKVLIPAPMLIRSANAYYVNFLNEVFVAIGISQFPLYHYLFPPALKYGGIGHIIGHEIAHAFDNIGFQFNYDGRVRNWWTEESLRSFRERHRCLEAQYNKFIFHGVATNGNLTLADNIADNVGIRLAYDAYWKATGNKDYMASPLPNVSFNNRQLFFIRFAQTWCSGQDITRKLTHMKTDVHANERFRVIGTLQNMAEFAETFQCKLGTSMNPLKKCVIW